MTAGLIRSLLTLEGAMLLFAFSARAASKAPIPAAKADAPVATAPGKKRRFLRAAAFGGHKLFLNG